MRALLVVLAVLVVVSLADVDCKPTVEFSDGKNYSFDLTGLCHAKTADDYHARDEDYNDYYFNICGEVSTASQAECAGAAVCQYAASGDYYNAGSLSTQAFTANTEVKQPGQGIIVTYSGGQQCSSGSRQTAIYLECDPTVEQPIFKEVEEADHCAYKVHATSKYACGVSAGGSDTAGLVILLIIIIAVVLYFAIGAIYQKKVKNASTAREYIIHNEFWCALPLMIKDGVLFIFHGCKKGDYVSV